MTQTQKYRQQAASLGIWDDKLEADFVRIMQDKDAELELERARVPYKIWELENRLMEKEINDVTA